MRNNYVRNRNGFTLVEVIVVVAIIAILTAVAVPMGLKWRENARFVGCLQTLTADLQRCKVAAIRDNVQCQVLLTANDYSVFLDLDPVGAPDSSFTPATADIMLNTQPWPPGFTVNYPTPPWSGADPRAFDFNGRGLATFETSIGTPSEVLIEINGTGGRQGVVRINMLGRVGQTY